MLYPLVWMLVSSLRTNDVIFSDPTLLPRALTLDNYVQGWNAQQHPFSRYFLNSLVVTAGSIVGNLLACSLTAYAFARLTFRFKAFWFAVMLLTIMLPEHVTIVPQYILFSELGWLNTFLPLVAPKYFATEAFFVFLMVQFIRGLPREIDEAAAIDGCGPFAVYWRIILPLIAPALATTAIFTFIWTWNDFFRPLIFLTDSAAVHGRRWPCACSSTPPAGRTGERSSRCRCSRSSRCSCSSSSASATSSTGSRRTGFK